MKIASSIPITAAMFGLLWAGGGCAVHRPAVNAGSPSLNAISSTTQPGHSRKALALEDIEPRLSLPVPTTRPTQRPPLEAIQLYAQARSAQLQNDRARAIGLLKQATLFDPDSVELHTALGKATMVGNTPSEIATAEFEQALALEPDHLDVQYDLARQYMARNEPAKALEHLRLARLTSDYKNDRSNDAVVLVDYWLARALQQTGYDRASLDLYDSLLHRLQRPLVSSRSQPELIYLVQHPEILYLQVGELYERNGQFADALHVYEAAASRDEDSFDLASRVIRTRLAAGKTDAAKSGATALVLRVHATPESLALLKDVYHRTHADAGYIDALTKLNAEHPADRPVFFALLDALKSAKRSADAQKLLTITDAGRFDPEITRKRFMLFQEQDDIESAMRLLVESLAARPDSLRDIGSLWAELLKPTRRGRLRLPTLQQMSVPSGAEAARLYWVAQLADIWNRDALARSAIEKAAALEPPFPPVYRLLVAQYWARPDWDNAQKVAECQKLADRVRTQGFDALATELEGRSLFSQGQPGRAASAFAKAAQLGNHSPDLLLMQARALYRDGNQAKSEQLLWKLISDWSQFEDAYSELFGLYLERRDVNQASGVLQKWLENDPLSIDARLLQANIYSQLGRPDMVTAAEQIVSSLVAEQPDNLKVLLQAEQFYSRTSRLNDFIKQLEDQREHNPENREAMEVLVGLYADQKRMGEASRVLDSSRAAVASDPDLLYYVAHLYERVDQKQTTEEILLQVVRLDPKHAAASNDLGYSWADQGKNLDRAEALIQVAVEAEPDNQSYLDSMGWVEYKRGKFTEARGFLDRAIGPASRPDPVVLDHMGDVLYRLAKPADAVTQWKRSLQRLEETPATREDLKQLRLQLMQKLQQQEQGRPVNVAPVVEMPVKPAQAAKS